MSLDLMHTLAHTDPLHMSPDTPLPRVPSFIESSVSQEMNP